MRLSTVVRGLACGALLSVSPLALAQPYSIPWHSVDGGGGKSTGGSYEITGTIGQPDAGLLAALPTYQLKGGFWAWTTTADSNLVVADSIDPAAVLTNFNYNLTVTNQGPEATSGVTVVNTLPPGVTFQSASAGCVHASGVVTCSLGSLAASASAIATITVQSANDGTMTNTALVYSDAVDVDPADDTALETTQIMHPRLTIGDVMISEGNSGSASAVFTVSLAPPTDQVVTVDFATLDGTATTGLDYTATQGSVTFNALETSKPVSVPVLGDTISEENEAFWVALGKPDNAQIHSGLAEGRILDDEGPTGGTTTFVSIADALPVTEGNAGSAPAIFTVTQIGPANPAATVNWTASAANASAGTDFAPASGVVDFTSGPVQTIQVPVLGDTTDEPNEAFVVNLTGASGATIRTGAAHGRILDDDGRVALCLPIAVVPTTLSASGSYCLVSNLEYTSDTGAAIEIAADNVLLDLNGYSLEGSGNSSSQAVGIHATDHQDITIRNGSVRGFMSGVRFEDVAGLSRGHVVQRLRASDNLLSGIWVEGFGSTVRNNLVVGSGGTTVFGSTGDAFGIMGRGSDLRVFGNDVIETLATGSGRSVGIDLRDADGSFVERNRVSNATVFTDSMGILLSTSDRGVMAVGNRLGRLDWGIIFGSALGKFQGNLASDVTTPYTRGTSAGNNQ
jgi:uncharacterized repeat protein (TIGR01451 family)